MKYDFTKSTPREESNAEKYTLRNDMFGTEDVEPVWVSDMDIDSPVFVKEAIINRANHQIYGYEEVSKDTFMSQINWLNKRYNTKYTLSDVLYSHSVVASMKVFIEAFSNIDDEVIVQTPVYFPFFQSVNLMKRKLLLNPLEKNEDGVYGFNIENLKKKITSKTKLLLLCNPHNPVGRAWSIEELSSIVKICKENNILIFSDEIHCDLVYEHASHIALSTIDGAKDISVFAYACGKTFNLSGLSMGTTMIQNEEMKEKFDHVYRKYHFSDGNVLSHAAFKAAYTQGEQWVDELKVHLYENYNLLKNMCSKHKNIISITPIQATYLAWLDCRNMNLSDEELKSFFIKKAKLGLNTGLSFGEDGSGYMRFNFGNSKEKMQRVVNKLDKALSEFKTSS